MVRLYKNFFEDSFTTCGYWEKDDSLYCITHDGFFMKINCNDFNARFFEPRWIGNKTISFNSSCSVTVGNNIFFFYSDGSGYLVYDAYEVTAEKKNLCVEPTPSAEKPNILAAITFNNSIFCFFRNNNEIIKIDGISGRVIGLIDSGCSLENACVSKYKDKALIVFAGTRAARLLDFKSESFSNIELGIKVDKLWDICTSENNIILMSHCGTVQISDMNGNIESYALNGKDYEYSMMVSEGRRIWIFPGLGKDIYYIEDGRVTKYDEYDSDFKYGANEHWFDVGFKYINSIETNNGIYFPARVGNKIVYINQEGELRWKEVHYRNCKKTEVLNEGVGSSSLTNFIDLVTLCDEVYFMHKN